MSIVLPDTSLCAIVSDEIINPAGGIAKFIDFSVPNVEEAIIVDTGSKDGTREALEELASIHKNLRVFDRKFDGFGSSRNFSLSNVRTKNALILDADERLSYDDFAYLKDILGDRQHRLYGFHFIDIHPDEWYVGIAGWNTRLIQMASKPEFHGVVYEDLITLWDPSMPSERKLEIAIKHFRPSADGTTKKHIEWYKYLSRISGSLFPSKAPSEMPSFADWKRYEPKSEEIYAQVKNWRYQDVLSKA